MLQISFPRGGGSEIGKDPCFMKSFLPNFTLKSFRRTVAGKGGSGGGDHSGGESSPQAHALGRFAPFAERVFIAEVTPDRPGVARSVVACFEGHSIENFDYPLAGSPFDGVAGQHSCCFEKDVLREFPGDAYLRRIGASGYAGISLLDASGKINGIIVFLDRKPLRNPEILKSILSIFAGRVAVEVENRRLDDALDVLKSQPQQDRKSTRLNSSH